MNSHALFIVNTAMRTIVVAGASGFVGSHVKSHFTSLGWRVLTVGRSNADAAWNDQPSLIRALNGAEAVLNLAGKSVNCRFTRSNVDELIRSRVETTRAIGEAIALCASPPKVWINAGGASIYREDPGYANTENSAADGKGTMAEVARYWESAFLGAPQSPTRKVILRITLVLGKDGGVFPIFKLLVKLAQGGKQGNGKQMMSWIHVTDLVRLIEFIIGNPAVSGVFNAAAPEPLSNQEFMRTFRGVMGFPFGIPAPAALIKVGTTLIGADSELILRGMHVVSERAKVSGFSFRFARLKDALEDLCKQNS